jgi:hypothetical protein
MKCGESVQSWNHDAAGRTVIGHFLSQASTLRIGERVYS